MPESEPTSADKTKATQSAGIQLNTPIQFIRGVGEARANKLRKLGLRIARDVLFFFPRSHELPPPPTRVDDLREQQKATFIGTIIDAELASRTPGRSVFAAIVENESGVIRILFFNQPFRADQLTLDTKVRISGTPKLAGLRWEFTHPKFEVLAENQDVSGNGEAESSQTGSIEPIYPLTEGVKPHELRKLTRDLAEQLADEITEVLPQRVREFSASRLRDVGVDLPGDLPGIATALRSMHAPETQAELTAAQARLVFQELLVMQLALAMRRMSLTSGMRAPPLECSAKIRNRILRRFPFELTADQHRVIETIATEMQRQFPMNRLLQGDVGSGKTVVAIFAMLMAVASGHQASLMAPTEVLARQHFATLNKLLADSRVRVGLLCGSLTTSERRKTLEQIQSGEIDLIVGTQALIHDINFHSLALCVIDEQHKFGVRQRVQLREGGVDPHYLVMSATPIPRSVAMTQFGDVDLSTLRDKPSGRGEVHTYLADDQWRERWWEFVRQRVTEGRQVYVVAPRVGSESEQAGNREVEPQNKIEVNTIASADPTDESPTESNDASEDVTSVGKTFEMLRNGPLSGLSIELLHGRMAAGDKQTVMERFADGDIDVLVTTTVIEVGIDVANATVMTILGANRFGLAQLHQLRGRISRGTHAGHVCVFTDGEQSPHDQERLKVFEQTNDGFELAEADFRMRGPGDVLGQRQSGLPPLRVADLSRDFVVLQIAREIAQDMIEEDPDLQADDMQLLRRQVLNRYGKRLELGDGA